MEKGIELQKSKRVSEYPAGSPQEFAEDMYWRYSVFDLEIDEVKKCCMITLSYLMQDSDGLMSLYYDMAAKYIKRRGVINE